MTLVFESLCPDVVRRCPGRAGVHVVLHLPMRSCYVALTEPLDRDKEARVEQRRGFVESMPWGLELTGGRAICLLLARY